MVHYSYLADRWWRAAPGASTLVVQAVPFVVDLGPANWIPLGIVVPIAASWLPLDVIDYVVAARRGAHVRWAATNICLSVLGLGILALRIALAVAMFH